MNKSLKSGFFLGMTSRNFTSRHQKHLHSFKFNKTNSTFAHQFLQTENIFSIIEETESIHSNNFKPSFIILISTEIFKSVNEAITSHFVLYYQLDLHKSIIFHIFNSL